VPLLVNEETSNGYAIPLVGHNML